MKISARIFELMEQKGMTQMELSEKTGIAQSVISDWHTKGTNPAANKLVPIAAALKVSVKKLLVSPEGEIYD